MKITNELSLYSRFLYQEGHISCKELKQLYPNCLLRSIYPHAKKKFTVKMPSDCRKLNRGRRKKIDVLNESKLLWTMQHLQNVREPFTIISLRMQASLMHLSTRTINFCLNKHNYKYLQFTKKDFWLLVTREKDFALHKALKKMVCLSV